MSWDEEEQQGGLLILAYLEDLFTISKYNTFDRERILMVLNMVANDEEFFDAGAFDELKRLMNDDVREETDNETKPGET